MVSHVTPPDFFDEPEPLPVKNEKIATPATTMTAMIPNDRRLRVRR